jgi:Iap family predicted aminopeptidase
MAEFDGDRAYTILESIAHERLAGTEGERKAAETLAGHLRGSGLEPELEEFRMWTYISDEARLEVLEPYTASYEAAVIGLSGTTAKGGLECGFKYVEDGSSQYLTDVAGKALLLSGGFSYEKVQELLEKKVAALVTVSNPHRMHNRKSWREQMRMRVGKLPSVDIVFDDGLELVKKGASRVRLHVKQDEREGISRNVVVEVAGTEFPDEVIVCVAHYDGISKSLGGHDNASGSAIMAELARCLADAPLKRTVRVVLCGGEEFGLYGSRDYVAKHKDEMENVRLRSPRRCIRATTCRSTTRACRRRRSRAGAGTAARSTPRATRWKTLMGRTWRSRAATSSSSCAGWATRWCSRSSGRFPTRRRSRSRNTSSG